MTTYSAPVEEMMFLYNHLKDNIDYNEIQKFKELIPYHDVEIFTAIDGKNIKNENDLVQKHFTKLKPMKPGEIGCFLSHVYIWEKISQQKEEHAFIFEDDPILCNNFVCIQINVSKVRITCVYIIK